MKNKKYGLPYRTYIWEGAAGEDLNGDGEIKNVAANPNTVPPTQELKEEGWCFAYGEEEWVDGKEFSKVEDVARGDLLADPPIQPQGRINCTTGETI